MKSQGNTGYSPPAGNLDIVAAVAAAQASAVAAAASAASAGGVVQDHIGDPTGAHAASAISFTPAGNVAATDVQAAIAELDTDKVPTSLTITAGTGLTGGGNLSANRTIAVAGYLENLANLSNVGFIVRTATPSAVTRTFTATAPVSVTNGNGVSGGPNISVSAASESASGVVELATNAEVATGTDTTRAVTAAGIAATYATKAYADSLVVGLLDDRGNYDASGNVFPSSGGSGTAGAILKGDLWTVSVAGTLGGVAVTAGDVLRAIADTPGQTAGNWSITENNLGYVPQNTAGTLALAGFSSITGTLPLVNLGGLGTGVGTALAINVGTAGSLVISGGALGTPSSGDLSLCSNYPLATTTTPGTVPALGGTGSTSAVSVGQLRTPPVDQIVPNTQVIFKNTGTGLIGLSTVASWFPTSSAAHLTGRLVLMPFSGFAKTVSAVSFISGGTSASGLTLARIGIYEVPTWENAYGAVGTLVASSASFTTIPGNSLVEISLSAPVVLDITKLYYVGLLQAGTGLATIRATTNDTLVAFSPGPIRIPALSDLPANLNGSVLHDAGYRFVL